MELLRWSVCEFTASLSFPGMSTCLGIHISSISFPFREFFDGFLEFGEGFRCSIKCFLKLI